jgi:hypothetical protein
MMLSYHLFLGLPFGLLVNGFHLNSFLAVLVSGVVLLPSINCLPAFRRVVAAPLFSGQVVPEEKC